MTYRTWATVLSVIGLCLAAAWWLLVLRGGLAPECRVREGQWREHERMWSA